MPVKDDRVGLAARRLRDASASGVPCPPVRDLIPPDDVDTAYAVQQCNTADAEALGRRAVGWKIGLTSVAVQEQLGVDQPDFGVLFADCSVDAGASVAPGRLLQPRIEAEVAFVLSADLPDRPLSAVDIRKATAYVAPALEIVDSRIAGWDITIADTVADNASSGLFVIGPQRISIDGMDLAEVDMRLTCGDDVVSSGRGAACLGDPLNAVVWLANKCNEVGRPLRAGDLVLSGALGPMVPVQLGASYRADITEVGSVDVTFEGA